MMAQHHPPGYVLYLRNSDRGALDPEEMDQLLCRINFEYAEHRLGDRIRALDVRLLSDSQFAELDRRVNPRPDHYRFKRKYLVSLADQVKIPGAAAREPGGGVSLPRRLVVSLCFSRTAPAQYARAGGASHARQCHRRP